MHTPRSTVPSLWVAAIGAGLWVFAARATVLQQGAGAAPYLDQWLLEADQIIRPWLEGRLSWTAFFAPHHEHYPVWPRLLVWLQVTLCRTWDPLVQGVTNAALCGVFVGTVIRWLARETPKLPALLLGALLVLLYSLPHSWENSIWGVQSAVPLCLLLSFWHLRGTLLHAPGSRNWWLAQAAGLAGLGSFGSAWAAPLAATAVVLWTEPRAWRRWVAPALLAALGLLLLFHALQTQPREGALALHAPDSTRFLGSWVLQAGWPSPHPFGAAVIYLPAFLLLLRLRGRSDARPLDLAALALVLLGLAQAAAFSFGRSAEYVGFVSRYSDFLSFGVFANALVLWRLGAAHHVPRWLVALLALPWLGTVCTGLREINRTGHTLYFQQNAAVWRAHRETALQRYIATRDLRHLQAAEARAHLYPAPETVARALETPGFPALLPASLRGDDAPRAGDAAGMAVRFLLDQLGAFTAAAGFLILLGLASPWPRTNPGGSRVPHPAPRFTGLALGAGLLSGGAVFLWPAPMQFDPETRLIRLVSTPDPVPDFALRIVTASPYPPDNLVGGASLWPEHFRNRFFGTHIDGPAFTGRAESSRFSVTTPYLIVPIAGYPASAGNGLLLEFLDAEGRVVETRRYSGANPDPVSFWSIDVSAHPGRSVRFAIEDGQAGGRESWIALAAPLPAARDLGPVLSNRWQAEQTAPARISLGLFSLVALGTAGVGAFALRRPRS